MSQLPQPWQRRAAPSSSLALSGPANHTPLLTGAGWQAVVGHGCSTTLCKNITADFLHHRPVGKAGGERVPVPLWIQQSTGPERGQLQGRSPGFSSCPPLTEQLQTTKKLPSVIQGRAYKQTQVFLLKLSHLSLKKEDLLAADEETRCSLKGNLLFYIHFSLNSSHCPQSLQKSGTPHQEKGTNCQTVILSLVCLWSKFFYLWRKERVSTQVKVSISIVFLANNTAANTYLVNIPL